MQGRGRTGRNVFDIIVVGGGPAGAATSYFLASAGARVALLDRARFPRDKPCAEYLSPQAARILSLMDAERVVEQAGAMKLCGMLVRSPDESTLRGDFVSSHGYRGFRDCGLGVQRRTLDTILLDRARAAGVQVREEARVTGLEVASGRVRGVTAARRDGGTFQLHGTLVVGADGLNSLVAIRSGLARRAGWPRRIALVAHYSGVGGMGDCGEMHVRRDGYLGLAAVAPGITNVALVVRRDRAAQLKRDPGRFLADWIASDGHLASRFQGAEREQRVMATGPFARSARRLWSPGVALVGDAADFFDPFTGEGVYTALRGGELLAEHALRYCGAPDSDEWLRRYALAAKAEFSGKQLVERLIAGVVAFPPLINRFTRVLGRKKNMADLLVGVTGDFVPAREVLRAGYLLRLLT